jgi:hypothetical protein
MMPFGAAGKTRMQHLSPGRKLLQQRYGPMSAGTALKRSWKTIFLPVLEQHNDLRLL